GLRDDLWGGGRLPPRRGQGHAARQGDLRTAILVARGAAAAAASGMNAKRVRMSALGVRRDKAALSSGCKPHPANAPAGSNRSSYGGNEVAEAFGERVTNWGRRECAGRNASERRASLEKDNAQADPTTLSGKADTAGGSRAKSTPSRCAGVG